MGCVIASSRFFGDVNCSQEVSGVFIRMSPPLFELKNLAFVFSVFVPPHSLQPCLEHYISQVAFLQEEHLTILVASMVSALCWRFAQVFGKIIICLSTPTVGS